jgi:hypothetical protein
MSRIMSRFIDARIPLVFADEASAGANDAVLLEGEGEPGAGRDYFMPADHPVGCACCAPRNGAGMALARLMLARGRGQGVFFRRVVAVTCSEAGRAAVAAALEADPLASACFRGEEK